MAEKECEKPGKSAKTSTMKDQVESIGDKIGSIHVEQTGGTSAVELQRGSAARSSAVLKRQNLPIAIQDTVRTLPFFANAKSYEELRCIGGMVVDKSLFIDAIVRSGSANMRICLPKGIGKTMNLKMAECFLKCPENGPSDRIENSPNYKYFKDARIFFDQPLVNQHFGKHPVIFMTLSSVHGQTLEIVVTKFRAALFQTCVKFRHIYDGLKESEDPVEAEDFNFLKKAFEKSHAIAELHISLLTLAQLLNRWHKKQNNGSRKVVILLDEYDKPVNNLHNVELKDEREAIMNFLGEFLDSSFKENEAVEMAIVAGIIQTGLPFESGLRFLECNLRSPTFQLRKHFGFNDEDIEEIKKALLDGNGNSINIDSNHLKLAKDWYNGYNYGDNNDYYNPSSFILFLNNYCEYYRANCERPLLEISKLFVRYYTNDAKLEALKELLKQPEVAEQLNMLLFGISQSTVQQQQPKRRGELRSMVQDSLSHIGIGTSSSSSRNITFRRISPAKITDNFLLKDYNDLAVINEGMDALKENKEFVPLFFSYLFHMGYLTERNNELCVPNMEISLYIKELMTTYYEKVYAFSQHYGDAVTDSLVKVVNVDGVEAKNFRSKFVELKSTLDNFFKAIPVDAIRNEFFPHAVLTYLLIRIRGLSHPVFDENKRTSTNEELKMDLSFHLKETTVIVEMKAGGGKEHSAETAFTEARYYRTLFAQRTDIKRFIFIGISLSKDWKKQVRIAYNVANGKEPAPEYVTPHKIALNATHPPKFDSNGQPIVRQYEEPKDVDCIRVPA